MIRCPLYGFRIRRGHPKPRPDIRTWLFMLIRQRAFVTSERVKHAVSGGKTLWRGKSAGILPDLTNRGIKSRTNGKNHRMARIVDLTALTVITFLLTFVWTTAAFDSWAAVFAVSCAAALMAAVTAVYIKRGAGKPCSCDRLTVECAVRPPSYLIGLLNAAAGGGAECGSNYILVSDAVVFAAVKLNPLGLNDLNALVTKAEELGRKRIFIITQSVDRRAYRIVQYHEAHVTAMKMRAVYRWLKKRGALPDLKRIKTKFSLAAFFEAAFRRGNLKHYLFSGFILVAVAFLTPLRVYYLIFGSISLIMALLTLTPLGKGPFGGEKILDTLAAESAPEPPDRHPTDAAESPSTDGSTSTGGNGDEEERDKDQ